jgi:AP endonuclease 1
LVNLANPDDEKRAKAFETFVDEIQRCEALKIQRFNFQYDPPKTFVAFLLFGWWLRWLTRFSPGTSADKEGGIKLIANCINEAHEKTSSVKLVLENAAGQNNSIGNRFEDLRDIIKLVKGNEIRPRHHAHARFRWG